MNKYFPYNKWAIVITAWAVGVIPILAAIIHNRTFWLDEAFIVTNLSHSSFSQLLGSQPLAYAQQFPKLYLALLKIIYIVLGPDTLGLRLLPLGFGLGGLFIWLLFFYETFINEYKSSLAFLTAAGLLLANIHLPYYAFELKQYSADFFFGGLFLWLFFTPTIAIYKKAHIVFALAILAPLFSYTSLFFIGSSLLCCILDKDYRNALIKDKNYVFSASVSLFAVLMFLYWSDFQNGTTTGSSSNLHAYWNEYFATGNTMWLRLASTWKLFGRALTWWWRIHEGAVSSAYIGTAFWAKFRFDLLESPDIKNFLCLGAITIFGLALFDLVRNKRVSRIVLAGLVLTFAALAALLRLYPWGQSRVSLYALPVAAFFISTTFYLFSKLFGKFQQLAHLVTVLLVSIVVVRNFAFIYTGFFSGPYRENMKDAFILLDPKKSHQVVVGQDSQLILNTAHKPSGYVFTSEVQALDKLKHSPAYFLWVNGKPDIDSTGTPKSLASAYTAKPVILFHPEVRMGLYYLEPISPSKKSD